MVESVKCEIIKFRSNQWHQFTSKLGTRPMSTKPFWNRINRLKNKKQQNKIPSILDNETWLETEEAKANAFGKKLELTFNDYTEPDQLFNADHYKYVDKYVETFTNRNLRESFEPR